MNGFDGIGDTSCYIHVIDATLCVNSYIYIYPWSSININDINCICGRLQV